MKVFDSVDAVRAAVGQDLGVSDWVLVDQDRIDRFADVTEDHQWIHVDRERAAASAFKTTIAHGFLTLSLIPHLTAQLWRVQNVKYALNYGCNKVRFPSPVPSGSRVRAGGEIASVEDVPGGLQVVVRVSISVEGAEKPSCVAETVTRIYS